MDDLVQIQAEGQWYKYRQELVQVQARTHYAGTGGGPCADTGTSTGAEEVGGGTVQVGGPGTGTRRTTEWVQVQAKDFVQVQDERPVADTGSRTWCRYRNSN
jgi:hypothetical protein